MALDKLFIVADIQTPYAAWYIPPSNKQIMFPFLDCPLTNTFHPVSAAKLKLDGDSFMT